MKVQLTLNTEPLHEPRWQHIEARDAQLDLLHQVLPVATATRLFETMLHEVPWRQDQIRIAGQQLPIPRLQQLYGDRGKAYTWSGILMKTIPWDESNAVAMLRMLIQHVVPWMKWNAVLVNLYRDGSDSVDWHSDDETLLGETPTIASLSLGAERDFLLRRYDDPSEKIGIRLPHNSLLLMAGTTQLYWQHSIPKRKGVREPRINLTFRNLE
jgi:alkylated DNA repair dioxygenase AlkB